MADMTSNDHASPETRFDQVLGFTLPDRESRGRIVKLGPVVEKIVAAHDYPPAITHFLAEALVLTALMGSLLKGEGDQLTIQAQSETGLIRLLVCDFRDDELRGYAQQGESDKSLDSANPSLETLFGKGSLAITFETAATGQRYQGVVPLEGTTLAEAVELYFAQSEQLPTLVRTAIRTSNGNCTAAGLLVQHFPDREEGRERLHSRMDHPQWEHVSILANTLSYGELVDPILPLEGLIWRLFHEEREIRIEQGSTLSRGCRCSETHFENVLSRFPSDERREMANSDGIILVDCAFCSKEFAIQD